MIAKNIPIFKELKKDEKRYLLPFLKRLKNKRKFTFSLKRNKSTLLTFVYTHKLKIMEESPFLYYKVEDRGKILSFFKTLK